MDKNWNKLDRVLFIKEKKKKHLEPIEYMMYVVCSIHKYNQWCRV